MAASTLGVGQYVASETHVGLWGRNVPAGRRGIVSVPGSGVANTAQSLWGTAGADDRARSAVLAEFFPIVTGDLSQPQTGEGTFGNSTAVTRVGQLKTFIQGSSFPVPAAAGKVFLVAGSGGAAAALNYARANPTLVAAIVGLCPLVDVQDIHDNNRGGFAAEIETAYVNAGTTYAAAMPASNPAATGNQAALGTIPIKLWYSTDDPYIPVATVTGFRDSVNAAGGNCTIKSMGAVGHTVPLTGCNPYEVVDFLLAA